MTKRILLIATLFSITLHSYAIELKVPIGAKGYLGEVVPPVASSTAYLHTTTLLEGNTVHYEISLRTSATIEPLRYFPEIGTAGIEFINTNNPDSGSIVLTINGALNGSFLRYNSDIRQNVSATVLNGKSVNLNGLYIFINKASKAETVWGIAPKSGSSNFFYRSGASNVNPTTFTVTSYSAYAIGGGLKAGVYKIHPGYESVGLVTTGGYSYEDGRPALFDKNSNVTITALKSCNLTPSTPTNIQYPAQLSQNYPTPKNLASEQAVVQVSCYEAGKEGFLTLGPLNPMVAGSTTGMVLTGSEDDSGDLPYIATSATSQGDSVCNANSSDAIPYLGSQSISTIPGKDFTKSLFFNLCANGNIKPGKYKGAINVSVLVE
ncbi:hypothetical protein [Providencia vermicola]|uniref:hypothetical protein n=1 Tax=Providencia vermicola TaxID=333965 RepID=UPI001CEC935B|nr:hypothetical protein [Providencia vermicola]